MGFHPDTSKSRHSAESANGQANDIGLGAQIFSDHRNESNLQRKMQEGANNSPQVQQLKSLQAAAKTSPQVQQATQLQEAVNQNAPVQRLAMKFGEMAPIPEDAAKIAGFQNEERGVNIDAQAIPGEIPDNVVEAMADKEKVYILAHGRAPLANYPAALEDGDGNELTGADLAQTISSLKDKLADKGKSIGEVKLEACMTSLARKTRRGRLGELLIKEKPSLVSTTKASLESTYGVDDVVVLGNTGFSSGTDFEGDGVENLSRKNTELGLLVTVFEKLDDTRKDQQRADWNNEENTALRKDGLNILHKYGDNLDAFDESLDRAKDMGSEDASSRAFFEDYLNFETRPGTGNDRQLFTLTSKLSNFIRQNPD